jgi:DNA-binding MarR family transcriptional regulator
VARRGSHASPPATGDETTGLRGLAGGATLPGGATEATGLDRLIHERVRLGIVSALAVNRSLSFNELKSMLGATDGNLSVHARRLEDAGYIICSKGYDGRVPRTIFRLSEAGRTALQEYLDHMESLIRAVREG